jgi:hypothetical protein
MYSWSVLPTTRMHLKERCRLLLDLYFSNFWYNEVCLFGWHSKSKQIAVDFPPDDLCGSSQVSPTYCVLASVQDLSSVGYRSPFLVCLIWRQDNQRKGFLAVAGVTNAVLWLYHLNCQGDLLTLQGESYKRYPVILRHAAPFVGALSHWLLALCLFSPTSYGCTLLLQFLLCNGV